MRLLKLLLLNVFSFLIVAFLVGCASAQSPLVLPVDPAELTVVNDSGTIIKHFEIEIAQSEQHRSDGLMFRTDLPKDRGMLFVFDDEELRFFWMENTPTPLDIIYADKSGRIVHIANDTTPFSRTPIPSYKPAKFAFEIHSGLSEGIGISIGDHLKHPIIEKK